MIDIKGSHDFLTSESAAIAAPSWIVLPVR